MASVFSKVAKDVVLSLRGRTAAAVDMDAEKQRVNSYIADVLKDAHVLYAKLARLQGDFKGVEQEDLSNIAQSVLGIGDKLSSFSKAFRAGELEMAETSFSYGEEKGGGGSGGEAPPAPEGGASEPVAFGEAPEEEEEAPDEEEEAPQEAPEEEEEEEAPQD